MPQPVPPGWLNNGSWALSSPHWWRVTEFLQKWAGKDLTKDHISANVNPTLWTGSGQGALWHRRLGPLPSPPWAGRHSPEMASCWILNCRLIVVLIRFGSSGLETHGSFKLGSFWGFYFSYIPREHLPKRERKEGSYGGNCTWDAWAHCALMTSWGFPRRECYLFLWIISVSSTSIPLAASAFPQDRKECCRAPAISNTGYLEPPGCILLPCDWVKRVRPETARGSCSVLLGSWLVTVTPSMVFPMVCLGPTVISKRPSELLSRKLMLCFTHWNSATRLEKRGRQKAHIVNVPGNVTSRFSVLLAAFPPSPPSCLTEYAEKTL